MQTEYAIFPFFVFVKFLPFIWPLNPIGLNYSTWLYSDDEPCEGIYYLSQPILLYRLKSRNTSLKPTNSLDDRLMYFVPNVQIGSFCHIYPFDNWHYYIDKYFWVQNKLFKLSFIPSLGTWTFSYTKSKWKCVYVP